MIKTRTPDIMAHFFSDEEWRTNPIKSKNSTCSSLAVVDTESELVLWNPDKQFFIKGPWKAHAHCHSLKAKDAYVLLSKRSQ